MYIILRTQIIILKTPRWMIEEADSRREEQEVESAEESARGMKRTCADSSDSSIISPPIAKRPRRNDTPSSSEIEVPHIVSCTYRL